MRSHTQQKAPRARTTPVIHLAKHCFFAGIASWCGAKMQSSCDRGWTNKINYWGRTGIVTSLKIEVLTFNRKHATCPECLKEERETVPH